MTDFKNQVAVVTGASSGIGKAIAMGLAERGATVCLVGRKLETLEVVADSIRETSSTIHTNKVDLTRDEDINELKARLLQDYGYIDILIHSAGVISLGRSEDANIEDFDWQYKTNVRAPYMLTQLLLPLIKSRRGQIVFINSSVGLKAVANVGQYAATKHALKAIADSLRDEVNADEIRVLSIFPGRTATPMQEAVHEMEGSIYQPESFIQPEDVAVMVVNTLSLPRSAEVTDINIRPSIKFN